VITPDPYADVIDEMQDFALNNGDEHFEPIALKNPNNKWIARSAFQKAMRRGQAERALRYGALLLGADVTYAWSALATVMIEDIGFGDLDGVFYSCITTLKSVRDKLPDWLMFSALVIHACEAPKSRSCCELSLGKDIQNVELIPKTAVLYTLTIMMESPLTTWAERYEATVKARQLCRNNPPEMLEGPLGAMMKTLPNPKWKRTAMMSFERPVDSMNHALFSLGVEFTKPERIDGLHVVNDTFPPSIEIMSVGSEAFDMHTKQGKVAIKAFWSELCKINPVFKKIDAAKAVKAVGSLVFIAEGGQVDQRYWNTYLADLKEYQDRNFAIGYGCPEEDWEEMLAVVTENIEILNGTRLWAAGNT
jgi:hypothetical protein